MNTTQNVRYCDWGYCYEPAVKGSHYCEKHTAMVEQAKKEQDAYTQPFNNKKNEGLVIHHKWNTK